MKVKQIDDKTWYVHGYMVFHSHRKGWTCECRAWMFNMLKKETKDCKHIRDVKEDIGESKESTQVS